MKRFKFYLIVLFLSISQFINAQIKILTQGEIIEDSISKTDRHIYQINKLEAGGLLSATVEQMGVDIVISVIDPNGNEVDKIDSPTGNQGKERINFVVQTSGNHLLKIYMLESNDYEQNSQIGNYKLKVDNVLSAHQYNDYVKDLKKDHRISWLKKNCVPIKSISPNDEDFEDLQPLKNIIGNAKIVMLGEQTHGDGATFYAKTRLIKFLHQEMGFDVLAFESGLYDVQKAWECIKSGENPVQAIRKGVFGIWTKTNELKPLIEYIGKKSYSSRPLEIAGFDCQFTGSASKDFYISDLKKFLSTKGINTSLLEDSSVFTNILRNTIEYTYQKGIINPPDSLQKANFFATLKSIVALLESKNNAQYDKLSSFWIQNLKSLESQALHNWFAVDYNKLNADEINLRDIQMGKNLIWLSNEYYPDRKIIVWAATMHIVHNTRLINPRTQLFSYKDYITMGDYVWQNMGDKTYTLGFTAYEGEYGSPNWKSSPVMTLIKDQAEELELEELMNFTEIENAIIDFRGISKEGFWLRDKLISRPLGNSASEANWTEVLDGMYYIRKMIPATSALTDSTTIKK